MLLRRTPFYKESRIWRSNFIEEYKSKPASYWSNYEIDIESYADKMYVLYLPHRTDKVESLTKKLQEIKTKNSNLLDYTTWWEGSFGKTNWDDKIHIANYPLYYCWSIDPNPKALIYLGGRATVQELEDINVCTSLQESNIALGHASILQDIVDNNISSAFIIEDDIIFSYGFSWLMEKMFKQLPEDWDIFYVSFEPCMYGFKSEPYSEDLVKVTSGVWWLSGVFISQRAAKKLVDNFPIIGPVDVWINHHFNDLNVFSTMYNCINQDLSLSSDNIHSFKKTIDQLKPIYK